MDRASDSGSEGWGFESLPVYQKFQIPIRVSGIFYTLGGTRKDGRAKRGKKVSGGHFFSPWESPLISGRIRYGCGRKSSIAELRKTNTFGCSFFFVFMLDYRKNAPVGTPLPGCPQMHHQQKDQVPTFHVIARSEATHPRVASLALRAIHLLAIRIPCGAKHHPSPKGTESERIATGLRPSQ